MRKLLGFAYGIIFGIANVIPGVSGGTMMVAFGCYDIVTDALALDFDSMKRNAGFLVPFGLGALCGIVGFSFAAVFLLAEYPLASYLFFIGLILGSLPTVYRTAVKSEKLRPSSLFPFLLSLGLLIAMGLSQDGEKDTYGLKQSVSGDDHAVTVVTFTNLSNQTISDWLLEFEEGSVSAVGGAVLVRSESGFGKIMAALTGSESSEPNAIAPADKDNSEIKPGETIRLTYVSPHGKYLTLEPQMSYKLDANLFFMLIFGGFCAAVAMIIPGVSGSFVMVLFGIYATVIGAVKDLNFLILLPTAAGIVCGVIFGAKLIKSLLQNHRMLVYSAIMGLMLGSVFVIFPIEHFVTGTGLVVGIAALILGTAIALAVSMEKKSNEDLKNTSENL